MAPEPGEIAMTMPAMTKVIQVVKLMAGKRERETLNRRPGAAGTTLLGTEGKIAGTTATYFFFGLTAAFRVAPAAKRGVFDAAILITSPVAGLRPLRAARLVIEKVPKPVIPTVSPFLRRSVMMVMMVFTASLAAAPDISVRFANSAISSPFFINPPG